MKAFTILATVTFLMACSIVAGDDKPDRGDLKTVQGDWQVIEHEPQGEPKATYLRAVFTDDKLVFHINFNEQTIETECNFKLDATTTPKQIDFTPTNPKNNRTYKGIYELKDKQLRISYRGPDSKRPKDFEDKKDGVNLTTFLVLKKD